MAGRAAPHLPSTSWNELHRMKAVNLLPSDLRAAAKRSAPVATPPGNATGAYAVLGALALCVAALAGYVLTSNTVAERQVELTEVTARHAVASRHAEQLRPYADFQGLAQARVETVRRLAASRFDWEQALRDLSHAVPAPVTLTSIAGTIAADTQGSQNPLRAGVAAPAIELKGCTTSQTAVASLMSRLRNIDGVTRVSVSKSDKETPITVTRRTPSEVGAAERACGGSPPAFEIVAFFEHDAALSPAPTDAGPAAPATTPASATATPTPTPTAGTSTPAATTSGAGQP